MAEFTMSLSRKTLAVHLIFAAALVWTVSNFVLSGSAREAFLLEMGTERALRHLVDFAALGVCYWAFLSKTQRSVQAVLCIAALTGATLLGGKPLAAIIAVVLALILHPATTTTVTRTAPEAHRPQVGLTLGYLLYLVFCYVLVLLLVMACVYPDRSDPNGGHGGAIWSVLLFLVPNLLNLFLITRRRRAQLPRIAYLAGWAPLPLFAFALLCLIVFAIFS